MQEQKPQKNTKYYTMAGLLLLVLVIATVILYQSPQRSGLRICLKLIDKNWEEQNRMYEWLQGHPSSEPSINAFYKYPPQESSFDSRRMECYERFGGAKK